MRQHPKSIKAFVIQSAFIWACVPILYSFMPIYLDNIGFRSSQIGILMALSPVLAVILQPFIGVYVDRSSSKNAMLILLTLGTVGSILLFPLSQAYLYVLVIGTILAIFQAAHMPIFETITLEALEKIGKSYGPVRLAGTISYSIVSILVGIFMKLDIKSIFYITAAIGILNILSSYLLPKIKGHQSEGSRVSFRELFRDKLLIVLMFFSMIAQLAISFYQNFFPIYFVSIGGTHGALGVLYFIGAMSELPFLLKADKIIEKLGIQKTLILSMVIIGLRFLLLFFIKTPAWFYPVSLLNGLTFIVFTFSLAVYINNTAKKELRATGQTIHGFAMAVGRILGSVCGGYFVEWFGLLNTKLISFAICPFCALQHSMG